MRHLLLTLDADAPRGFERVPGLEPGHLRGGTFALWAGDPAAGEAAVRPFENRMPLLLVSPAADKAGLEHCAFNVYRLRVPAAMRDEACACACSILDLMRAVADADDRGQSLAIDLSRAADDRRRLSQEFATARANLLQELSERRTMEHALRDSEARYRMILDSVSDAILIDDPETGAITQVNRRMCELYKCTPQEALDLSFGDLSTGVPPYTHAEAITRMRLAAKGEPQIFEWHARDRQGRLFWADVTMRRADLAGQPRVIVTVRDISGRKAEQEAQRRLAAQMQHAQKLESLGFLAGAIAHDFNNHLTTILGNVDLANADRAATLPCQANLTEIEQAAKQAAELCRQLLAYAGKGRFVVQKMDLGELVQEMVYMLEVSVSRKAVMRYNLAPDLPPVDADAAQMRQMLLNLVVNAAESIGERTGEIAISTGVQHCDRTCLGDCLLGDTREPGVYVFLEVADSGAGMDPATLDRIFEPFFSTKFAGRGLGLAAVLGIVRGHGGAIRVTSEPNRGTTFRVLLPAATSAAATPPEPVATEEAPAAWRGTGTVLVVDDEESVRSMSRQMLERMGFRVLLASDGREAVQVFREVETAGTRIACVLLDLTMPQMDGEEAFRELRRLRQDATVVLMSGYSEQALAERFSGMGLSGFVQKPFRMAALQRKMADLLGCPPAAKR
jgi:PAS domain S-box-containing protein